MSGRLLANYNSPDISPEQVRQIIDATSYSAGVYIITMKADNEKYNIKFVKE